jgi:hypothetical protein
MSHFSNKVTIQTGASAFTRCLDLDMRSRSNGAQPHQWDCDANNAHQHWTLLDAGDRWYRVGAAGPSPACHKRPLLPLFRGGSRRPAYNTAD